MKHSTPIIVIALLTVGCKQPSEAPVAPVASVSTATDADAEKLTLLYTLLDAPVGSVTMPTATPQKCVLEIMLGKDVLYKDVFLGGTRTVGVTKGKPAGSVFVGLRPVDSGELSKARRIRYAFTSGGVTMAHLVRNPFIGLTPGSSLVDVPADQNEGKPTSIINFVSPTNPSQSATVRITTTKATDADLKEFSTGEPIHHWESPWAKGGGVKAPAPARKKK